MIAFCDTDASLKFVDVAIPTNNKSRHSIGLMWYLLCREVLRLRGTVPRGPTGPSGWDVLPDLFFYRDPEEEKAREDAEKLAADAAGAEGAGDAVAAVDSEWNAGATADAIFAAQPSGDNLDWTADATTQDWTAEPAPAQAAAAADASGGW